ncbi:TolB family protein [Ornatilinea apprima]|uniref:TolB family protein n=1 Tax=Ornatilinea apprima TaxID=1134406 RepID=UPI0009466D12|nr:PD40 domain-containing protein [Ornatilinea apprima]
MSEEAPQVTSPKNNHKLYRWLLVLVILNLILMAIVVIPAIQDRDRDFLPGLLPTSIATPTILPQTVAPPSPAENVYWLNPEGLKEEGVLVLSIADGYYDHLFIFQPQNASLLRLTNSPYDDITPAFSPDGNKIAFSSRRNGYWDLFILDLTNGEINQVTDTPEYDGDPSWSPDGNWLAYESYQSNNLEILIRSLRNPEEHPIRLTDHPAADTSPSWSPGGRRIAFVSTRDGDEDIWLAALDNAEDRFFNLTRNAQRPETNPVWSQDGRQLAWSALLNGQRQIMLWDGVENAQPAALIDGSLPAWCGESNNLFSVLAGPNQYSLFGWNTQKGLISLPAMALPGRVKGMDCSTAGADVLASYSFPDGAADSQPNLWAPALNIQPLPPAGRFGVVPLEDVAAPYPYLHDTVDESFRQLRDWVSTQAGWDVLSSLEKAFTPITEPPTLPLQQNWLYTGRAFAINPLPLQAGWMAITREDYNGQVYWRVYIRARYQDGSQGIPLHATTWDLNQRYAGNPTAYEEGGASVPAPQGYWVDFTDMAARFGWQRLPALQNWRSFYAAARFNQFILTDQIDWQTAMNELYPPEALTTATLIPTLTPVATQTPLESPPASDLPQAQATIRPTWTPLGEQGQ